MASFQPTGLTPLSKVTSRMSGEIVFPMVCCRIIISISPLTVRTGLPSWKVFSLSKVRHRSMAFEILYVSRKDSTRRSQLLLLGLATVIEYQLVLTSADRVFPKYDVHSVRGTRNVIQPWTTRTRKHRGHILPEYLGIALQSHILSCFMLGFGGEKYCKRYGSNISSTGRP